MTARPTRSSKHSIRDAGSEPDPGKTARLGARRVIGGFGVIALFSCVAGLRRPSSTRPVATPSTGVGNESAGAAPQEPAEESPEPESSGDTLDEQAPPLRVREASGKYNCESPRPRVCEATISPVCAQVRESKGADESSQAEPVTVLNGCLACADPGVVSYVEGRCLAPKNSSVPSPPSKR
jgi:hypothetical protein